MQPWKHVTETIENNFLIAGVNHEEIAPIREAAEKVLATPEGREVFNKIFALHHKRVVICVYNQPGLNPNLMGLFIQPDSVYISMFPETIKRTTFESKKGGQTHFSFERFIAHEMEHGTQVNATQLVRQFHAKMDQGLATIQVNAVDVSKYARQISSAGKDMGRLKTVFTALYDNQLKAPMEAKIRKTIAALMQDPDIKNYLENCEGPAIAFENVIARKFGQEERIEDYIGSTIESSLKRHRENVIMSMVYTQLKSLGALPPGVNLPGRK